MENRITLVDSSLADRVREIGSSGEPPVGCMLQNTGNA